MSNIDWDAIDKFVSETDKDDRYGDHDAMVTSVSQDAWDNGEKFYAVEITLKTTRNNASLNFRLSDPMSVEQIHASNGSDNARGVAFGQKLLSELHKYYGLEGAQQLKPGDMLRVKVGPQKSKKTGSNFPRVVAFLPKDQIGTSAAADSSAPPF